MKTRLNTKILIVDVNKLFRKTFGSILETSFNAQLLYAEDERELFSILNINQPDLIILDLYSISAAFSRTFEMILEKARPIKVIVLSFDINEDLIETCISNGAKGFFDKNVTDTDLIVNSINKVLLGETITITPQPV